VLLSVGLDDPSLVAAARDALEIIREEQVQQHVSGSALPSIMQLRYLRPTTTST
jgi:hypothetical protein